MAVLPSLANILALNFKNIVCTASNIFSLCNETFTEKSNECIFWGILIADMRDWMLPAAKT
jgi:hypothetical protein